MRFKRIHAVMALSLVMVMLMSTLQTFAYSKEDGETDYNPPSFGDYGWRTYGFHVTARDSQNPGEEIFIGDFLWRNSDGNPQQFTEWDKWNLGTDVQPVNAQGEGMLSTTKTVLKAFLRSRKAIAETDDVTITLHLLGVKTHKTNDVIDMLYYDGTMHSLDDKPTSLSQLSTFEDIIRTGYGDVYRAYSEYMDLPVESGSMEWAHPLSYYESQPNGTKIITIMHYYSTVVELWATSDASVEGRAVVPSAVNSSGQNTEQTMWSPVGNFYFWEKQPMSIANPSSSEFSGFPSTIGKFSFVKTYLDDPTTMSSKETAKADDKRNRHYYVVALYKANGSSGPDNPPSPDKATVHVEFVNESGSTVYTDSYPHPGAQVSHTYTPSQHVPPSITVDTSKPAKYTNNVSGNVKTAQYDAYGTLTMSFKYYNDFTVTVFVKNSGNTPPSGGEEYTGGDSGLGSTSLSARGNFYSPTYGTGLTIPSGKTAYGSVSAPQYYFSTSYRQVSGTKNYPVELNYTWTLEKEIKTPIEKPEPEEGEEVDEGADEEEWEITYEYETYTGSFTLNVTRNYSYTELSDSYSYDWLNYSTMDNGALSGTMNCNYGYSPASLSYVTYGGTSSHIIEPKVNFSGVLDFGVYQEPFSPSASQQSACQGVAESAVGQIMSRSDRLVFNGVTVLSDSYFTANGDTPSSFPQAPTVSMTGQTPIAVTKANNLYSTWSGAGSVYYSAVGGSSSSGKYITFTPSNSITVHTPVYVDATVSCDNSQYVQSKTLPGTDFTLVTGSSDSYGAEKKENISCDFSVRLSNSGQHISSTGYGNNTYTEFVLNSGAGNQIRFTSDMYIDVGTDNVESNDVLIPSGTWFSCRLDNVRYYLPMWVPDGSYTMEYRSIAYNGSENSAAQQKANTTRSNYIATGKKTYTVIGKMYGFSLTDIDSEVDWADVFTLGTALKHNDSKKYKDGTLSLPNYSSFDKTLAYYYTPGVNNELGLATGRKATYTLPLIAGSSPKTKNVGVLKAGYTWKFRLNTTGTTMAMSNSSVIITPSFYWISEDGKKREKVDLYYTETWNNAKHSLVKVGSSLDLTNVKSVYANSSALAIPKTEHELTAKIWGYASDTAKWKGQYGPMYTYGLITSNKIFKTYSNSGYAQKVTGLKQKTLTGESLSAYMSRMGISEYLVDMAKQTYYFEYGLPASFHAVSSTYGIDGYLKKNPIVDYSESFWKKDGYILVHFDIRAYDENGNEYISYADGYADMFIKEGFEANRTDYYGVNYRNVFSDGDVFMVYADPNKTKSSDYIAVRK